MNTEEEKSPPSAGRLINELARASHVYFHNEFKHYTIGHAQIRTLFFVSNHQGLTQKELAQHLNLDKSSITSQLQIMEKNGYISRKASEKDARKQVIDITDKTREILEPIKTVLNTWSNTILAGFSDEEHALLIDFLFRMRTNAKARISTFKNTPECK